MCLVSKLHLISRRPIAHRRVHHTISLSQRVYRHASQRGYEAVEVRMTIEGGEGGEGIGPYLGTCLHCSKKGKREIGDRGRIHERADLRGNIVGACAENVSCH